MEHCELGIDRVYRLSEDTSEDTQWIDFEDERNAGNDWLGIDDAINNDSNYVPSVRLTVNETLNWGYFPIPGTLGIFSSQFVESIGTDSFRLFSLLPCQVNDETYFFLRPSVLSNCLNKSGCVYKEFPGGRICDITHFSFHAHLIPKSSFFLHG